MQRIHDDDLDYNFMYCETFEDVKQLVKYCKQTGYCCNDFETNAEPVVEPTAIPTIVSISFQPGSAWVVPLAHKDSPMKSIWKDVLNYIGIELIENKDIIKIGQNVKFEYKWWGKYGITMRGILHDTMLAKYMLDEERPHDLKSMVGRYIPEFDGYDLKGQPGEKAEHDRIVNFWSNVPIMELSLYGALDADLTFRLWVFFESRIIENGFYPLLRNMLMMATRVLAEVETVGMYTDRAYLTNLVDVYDKRISDCEKTLRSLPKLVKYEKKRLKKLKKTVIKDLKKEIKTLNNTGGSPRVIANKEQKINNILLGNYSSNKEREMFGPINFASPKQLIDLFFHNKAGFNWDVVSYTIDKKTKRKTNTPSVGEDVLKVLQTQYNHPVLETLLELRSLSKLNSTYVTGMLAKLRSNDRIHGSFLLHGTVTGRLSSRDPNLQNIPRDTTAADIKKMFIAPKPKLILQLDYSQAELRVMAYLAQEETMLHWFKIGHDIHLATACKKYGVRYEDIEPLLEDENNPEHKTWKIRRKQAKCYSPDTEVLTVSGWQRLDSYNGDKVAQYNFDTEVISFTEPENYGKVLSKNNYTYQDRNIDLDITDDHKTLFITRSGVKIKTEFKNIVGKSGYMPCAGNYLTKQPLLSNDFTRFIAMFTADGNIKESGAVRFGFSKERKIVRCREILNSNGFKFTENTRDGITHFYLLKTKYNLIKLETLLKFVNIKKQLSWECLVNLRGDQYLKEAVYWDSSLNTSFKNDRSTFYTTVEQTADVMQAMGSIYGIRVIKTEKRKGHFRLSYRPEGRLTSRVSLSNAKPYYIENGKYMYSVTVPDRNLVIRKNGKVVLSGNTTNFGIAYEQGPQKLAEKLTEQGIHTTKEEAQVILDEWFKDFPKIKKFIDNQHKKVKKDGYMKNLFGRKRRLATSLGSGNKWQEAEALRQSVNSPIQGSASDFALFSSVLIRENRLVGNLPITMEQFGTVHDSLMFYIYPEDIHKAVPVMAKICANPETLRWFNFEVNGVEMKVDFEIGTNWGELRKYNPNEDYTKWV